MMMVITKEKPVEMIDARCEEIDDAVASFIRSCMDEKITRKRRPQRAYGRGSIHLPWQDAWESTHPQATTLHPIAGEDLLDHITK